MKKTPKSDSDIIKGPFKVKTRRQMDMEERMMAEGGKVDYDKAPQATMHPELAKAAVREHKKMKANAKTGFQGTAGGHTEPDETAKAIIASRKMAEGGEVQPKSIADAIRMRKAKMMAEGGQVDLESNEMEEPSTDFDELNEAALKENYDGDITDLTQPEDSNEHAQSIQDDRMDRIAAIRRRLHKMR